MYELDEIEIMSLTEVCQHLEEAGFDLDQVRQKAKEFAQIVLDETRFSGILRSSDEGKLDDRDQRSSDSLHDPGFQHAGAAGKA